MDNVILWIKSNKDVVDVYKRTKADCNYHNKSDNDFLMFLLEAATNVLSIVHQFSPQITSTPLEEEMTPPETIVTKEDEINLEKLDKQLRINIICPELESPTTTTKPAPVDQDQKMADSSSALKDISDNVKELESVLESLNKSCPSPLPPKTVFKPLSSRSFLESLKPSEKSILNSMKPSTSESSGFLKSSEGSSSVFSSDTAFKKTSDVSFTKFKTPNIPNMVFAKRSLNANVRSSPNVTISAESQLNLAMQYPQRSDKPPTIIKPVPIIAKSPDHMDRSTTPPEDKEMAIDVVNPDQLRLGSRDRTSPIICPLPDKMQTDSHHGSPQSGGVKRKAECMDSTHINKTEAQTSPGASETTDPLQPPPSSTDKPKVKEELTSPKPSEQELPQIPSDTELTKQLMSVIQSTLSQNQNITCQECGLIFANEINLHRHMLTHIDSENNGAEQFNCPTCAFKTPRRQTLAKHINTVHSRDRSSGILYCDQCEYKTPTKSHLRNHMLAHTGNRQYQCPHCTYNSNFSNALTRHMTMHSRELFESKVGLSKP